MTILLIVEKNGNIKETKVKSLQVSELYKKAGFKSEEGFLEPVVSWPRPGVDPFTLDYQIQVFGKIKGRAGQENKYDVPPPIDTTLFFGNVAMIAVRPDGGVVDLTMSAWEMVYEQLFGGFEDLVDSHGRPLDDSEEDSEEDEELEGVEYTKDGYVKDDFVVDDDEDEYVEDEDKPVFRKLLDSEEEDSEFEPPSKKSAKSVKKANKKPETKSEKKTVAKKSAKSVAKKSVEVVMEIAPVTAPVIPEVVVDNFVKVEKKSKKSKKAKSEPVVLEIPEPEPIASEPVSEEEEPETKTKKPRKARAVKEPKEAKVKKVKESKEPKEKSETKKKTKRSGKKILDDIDSETVYVPMDTTELEEEKYV